MQQLPSVQVDKFNVYYDNKEELLLLKKEIFSQHCYYFETNTARPFIIDAGAHIGLATLYFKKQYPLSRIVTIEPEPQNFMILGRNIWENKLSNITTVQAALATESGKTTLHVDQKKSWRSTTSQLQDAWNGELPSEPITVNAITLSSLLTEPVDLLKLDIEGSELAVLQEADAQLGLVDQLFIEFHPHSHQSLSDLIALLTKHQYRLNISKDGGEITLHQAYSLGLVLVHAQRR